MDGENRSPEGEREITEAILSWCRDRRYPTGMRSGGPAGRECIVMRIDAFMPRAFDADGKPTAEHVASGPTWGAVLASLASVPAEPPPPPAAFTATYSKLATGEWAIRVIGGPVREGDRITVTKRSGEQKVETVARVLSSVTGGASICSIVPTERPAGAEGRSARERRGGRRYGSTYTRFSSGAEVYTNRNGRCEDAPCCGCCS